MCTNIYTATLTFKVLTISEGTGWYDRLVTCDEGYFSKIRKTPKEMAITIYKKVSGYRFPFTTYLELGK